MIRYFSIDITRALQNVIILPLSKEFFYVYIYIYIYIYVNNII